MDNVQVQACSLLFNNKALTSKSATIKTNNWLCEGYPSVNAPLWHPGEQAQNHRHRHRPVGYYNMGGGPRVSLIVDNGTL